MSVDALRHKLTYLSEHVPAPICELVRANLRTHMALLRPQTTLPLGVWGPLEVDILYGLFRHRCWLGTPIVVEILVEFLATEYRLPQGMGHLLIEDQMATLGALLPTHIAPASDRDFLQYIFVETATAASETDLVADLGIGSAMIKKLRSAAVSVMKGGSQATFLPDVDATISAIMIAVAREIKATPWALDLHRLRYALRAAQIVSTSEIELEVTFDLLTNIGAKGSMSFEQIIDWLKHRKLPEPDSQQLIESLLKADLVFLSEHKRPSNVQLAGRKYSLTKKAGELTATCYIRRHFRRTKDPLKKLLTLPGAYQKAAIEQLDDADLMIELLRDHTVTLTPEALRAAITQIAKNGHETVCMEIIQKTARESRNPWLRKAAIESIRNLKSHEPQRSNELVRAAREDSSAIVKCAATLTLIALNESEKAVDLLMTPHQK